MPASTQSKIGTSSSDTVDVATAARQPPPRPRLQLRRPEDWDVPPTHVFEARTGDTTTTVKDWGVPSTPVIEAIDVRPGDAYHGATAAAMASSSIA